MTDPLGVTPDELRSTSQHLGDVSARMKDVLSTLRANLGGEGAAWGDDRTGEQFADGDGGYLSQLKWMDGSISAKTNLLDYYSRGLKGAADSFEQNEEV